MPPSISAARRLRRSATLMELASLVVPNTARPPAPSSSSARHKERKRAGSGRKSAAKGVSTGTSTPENRCRDAGGRVIALGRAEGAGLHLLGRQQDLELPAQVAVELGRDGSGPVLAEDRAGA